MGLWSSIIKLFRKKKGNIDEQQSEGEGQEESCEQAPEANPGSPQEDSQEEDGRRERDPEQDCEREGLKSPGVSIQEFD